MVKIKLYFFMFSVIFLSLFPISNIYGYNTLFTDCYAECGGINGFPFHFCKVIVDPSITDISYDVSQNMSIKSTDFTNCETTASSHRGNEIECVINDLNYHINSFNFSYTLNQTTSTHLTDILNESEIFSASEIDFQNYNSFRPEIDGDTLAIGQINPLNDYYDCISSTFYSKAVRVVFNEKYFNIYNSQKFYYGPRNPVFWTYNYGNNFIPFRSVMMHELGHNLGFAHQDQIMDTMSTSNGGGDYMYGYDYGQYIPSPDFMKGLNYIYGPLSINDVAISPYLFGVAPTAPPGTSQKSVYFSPESITTCPGNSDPYKFSIHNRFNNYKNFTLKFYISSNKIITVSDIEVASISIYMTPFSTYQSIINLNFPSNIPYNSSWYLGAKITNSGDVNTENDTIVFDGKKQIDFFDSLTCNP